MVCHSHSALYIRVYADHNTATKLRCIDLPSRRFQPTLPWRNCSTLFDSICIVTTASTFWSLEHPESIEYILWTTTTTYPQLKYRWLKHPLDEPHRAEFDTQNYCQQFWTILWISVADSRQSPGFASCIVEDNRSQSPPFMELASTMSIRSEAGLWKRWSGLRGRWCWRIFYRWLLVMFLECKRSRCQYCQSWTWNLPLFHHPNSISSLRNIFLW